MKAIITFLICLLAATAMVAQPVINDCENFTIGTVLNFQKCITTGTSASSPGAGQIWNFAALTATSATSTETMVDPSATSRGSLFPSANLVEKYSDGTFVYIYKTAHSNYIVGFADTINNYTITYPNTLLFAVRPITYGNIITDTFTNAYTSSSYNFTGTGLATVNADGYGTLMLPTGTFTNVLRVKITQVQSDTTVPAGTVSTTTTISYVWFDSLRTSALLKIDSTNSGGFISKDVEYLTSETPTGIKPLTSQPSFQLYPNPSSGKVNIVTSGNGTVSIVNQLGQTVSRFAIQQNDTQMSVASLPPGIYYVQFQTRNQLQTLKLVVQ